MLDILIVIGLFVAIMLIGFWGGVNIDKWTNEQRQLRYFACIEKIEKETCDRIHYDNKI